jgi:hypothetical protein
LQFAILDCPITATQALYSQKRRIFKYFYKPQNLNSISELESVKNLT